MGPEQLEPLSKDEISALVAKGMLSPDVANALATGAPVQPAPTAEIPPIVQPMNSALVPGAANHVAPAPMPGGPGDAAAMSAVAAKMGAPGAPTPLVPAPPPNIATTTSTFNPATLTPAEKTSMGIPAGTTFAQPSPPMKPKMGPVGGAGPSPTAVSALAKVYTPAQIAGFGLKAEEIAQAGEHNAALAETQANKAGEDAETVQAALDVANTKLAKMQASEEERKQVKLAALSSLNTKWDELANTQVDPERYWNSKDTGEKVLATIGLILGGVAGGLQGTGRNPAMDILQSNINRDVEAQKATFMAKSQAQQGKENVFKMMMGEFGDERMAEQATYATHWDMVSKELNKIALTSQNDVTKENALYAKQYADNQVAQYVTGVQSNAELTLKQMQANAAAAAHAKMAARDEAIWKANLDAAKAKATEIGGEVVPDAATGAVYVQKGVLPDGRPNIVWEGTKSGENGGSTTIVTGFNAQGEPMYGTAKAGSKEAAGKLATSSAQYAEVQQDIAALEALHEKAGVLYDTAKEKKVVQGALAKLKADLAKAKGIPLRGAGADMINSMVPSEDDILHDPLITSDPAKGMLDELKKGSSSDYGITKATGGAGGPAALPLTEIEGGNETGGEE